MKILFNRKVWGVCLVILAITIFSSCEKKKSLPADNNNSMANAFLKAQNTDKPKAKKETNKTEAPVVEEKNIPAVERIKFNKDNAVVDNGNKTFNERKAIDVVRDMTTGWNLGNTFDASNCSSYVSNELDYESAWCGVKTTKELISEIKNAGFKSIRIPVSWHEHVDANYNISEAWLSRVEEVVGWAYDEGMYVILNIHHDNDENHEYPSYAKLDQSKKYLTAIWRQLADRFADYDEHLIFETMNEPRLVGTDVEWWIDEESEIGLEALDCINQLNQAIVDTIRDNGKGYNKTRYIMTPGYCASPNFALSDAFKLPDDSKADAENRIIVSVHAYTPYNFALNQNKNDGATDNFSISGKKGTDDIDWFMSNLYNKFVLKGIPVIIGEFGALDKNNLNARMEFTAYYIATARHYGMSAFVWDNNAYLTDGENFRLIDRSNCGWVFPEIVDQMMYYCKDSAE